jgi:HCOMODA/2-hydroxy-3-carboxy-muconic semialdehyde decarboxylase
MTNQERLPADREGVASAARMASRAGLFEAFGHVSARSGDGFFLTSTRPLGSARAEEVVEVAADGSVAVGVPDVPLETPMHAAIYGSREDVGAICRTHSPAAVEAGSIGAVPPVVHGLGGLSGPIRTSDYSDLVSEPEAAGRIAGDLGDASCILLRGNGAVVVGRDLGDALIRAWYLEERCRVAGEVGGDAGFSDQELEERSRWFDREAERAWAWFRWKFGTEPE